MFAQENWRLLTQIIMRICTIRRQTRSTTDSSRAAPTNLIRMHNTLEDDQTWLVGASRLILPGLLLCHLATIVDQLIPGFPPCVRLCMSLLACVPLTLTKG